MSGLDLESAGFQPAAATFETDTGSFDDFAGKVIRIGHMGSNANLPDMVETMRALDLVLRDLGVKLEVPLDTFFLERVRSLEN